MSLDFVHETLNRPPEKSAYISDCGTYRYNLYRTWAWPGKVCPVVMVNPSTADAEVDDPTILRLMAFARRWGYGTLYVLNLFALRSPDPEYLDVHPDPVGPCNEAQLYSMLFRAAKAEIPVLCAWGNNGVRRGRDQAFLKEARKYGAKLVCLGLTEAGNPKHPLARGQHRIPDDFEPILFGETP
jgi:hypothetical protein